MASPIDHREAPDTVPEAVERFRAELVARQPEELARVTEPRADRPAATVGCVPS